VPDARVRLDERIGILALRERFADEVGMRQVWLVHLHEVDVDKEGLVRGFRSVIEKLHCRLLDLRV